MTADELESTEWFQDLRTAAEQELLRLRRKQHDMRPALQAEGDQLEAQIRGWTQSLGNANLDSAVRSIVEESLGKALERKREIEAALSEQKASDDLITAILDPQQILERLERLSEVLALNNPSLGNLELSLHIDRITCDADGQVVLRTCRLGPLAEAVDLFRLDEESAGSEPDDVSDVDPERVKPRRRALLRIDDTDSTGRDLKALVHWAADPHRFAGLPECWFEEQVFQVPENKSWAEEHAAEIFQRRQEAQLSYAALAKAFGVTPPTARAAVLHYLAEHPDARDEVNLPRGGKRQPKIDVTQFGNEARSLWVDGWSKLKLAEKYGCSTPTIDKALRWAYAQEGLPLPTARELKQERIALARNRLEADCPLEEIARRLNKSDVTARQYLRESFAKEGKPMPDLRSRCRSRERSDVVDPDAA